MFTVHCTRKLLDRVKAPAVEACEPTTLLGNWYATALFWRPRQVALIVNEKTLLAVFVPLAPASSLGDRIGESVGLVLEALGVGIDVVLQETAEMVDVSFAKTANRSVIGSMNEFAYHAEFRNGEGWDDLTAIATDLADMPCGRLYKTYVTPRDALHAAIGEATGQPAQPRGSRTSTTRLVRQWARGRGSRYCCCAVRRGDSGQGPRSSGSPTALIQPPPRFSAGSAFIRQGGPEVPYAHKTRGGANLRAC